MGREKDVSLLNCLVPCAQGSVPEAKETCVFSSPLVRIRSPVADIDLSHDCEGVAPSVGAKRAGAIPREGY